MTSKIGLIPVPFTTGFYQSRSPQLAHQRLINWYPNAPQSAALNPENLYHCSGIQQAAIAGEDNGINRGGKSLNGRPHFVNGNFLYRLDRVVNPDLSVSYESFNLGFIDGIGRVQMDTVGNQLCIVVPGDTAYIYTETSPTTGVLQEISDPDFLGPVDDVVALDSVFVFCQTGTNIVFHSDLNDGLSYLAFDAYPVPQLDVVIGLAVYRNQLYVFGDKITVPFTNIRGLEFLFAAIPNAIIDTGLRTKFSKTPFRQSLVWLGAGDNAEVSIWLYAGGALQKISTEAIDYIIQNMSDEEVERAFMLRHSQNGAEFVAINIGDYCLKYDFTTGIWHEQRSRIPAGPDYIDAPWRVSSIVQAYNRVFVGDAYTSLIGETTDALGTEYGINMTCVWESSPLSNSGVKGKVWAIEVFTDVGVSGGDVMNLSWSDDGGYTYSNTLERSLGAIGQYGRRLVWDRLGSFSIARQLRLEYSGQYPRGINMIQANAQ